MTINLTYANQMVLEALFQESPLASTIKTVKRADGVLNKSVDILVDPLQDVSVKTYTKAMKAANENYDFDDITLTTVSFNLTDEMYAAVKADGHDTMVVTAENVSDYEPIIRNLVNKLKKQLEGAVGAVINGLSGANVSSVTLTGADDNAQGKEIIKAITGLYLDFDANGVPADNLFLVAGREAGMKLLASDALQDASKAGDAGESQALRKAIIGEVANFTVFISDKVDANSVVGYHSDGFALVSAAPGGSVTATYSELASRDNAPIDIRVKIVGLGARLADGVVASTFFTAVELVPQGAVSNPRAKKINFV